MVSTFVCDACGMACPEYERVRLLLDRATELIVVTGDSFDVSRRSDFEILAATNDSAVIAGVVDALAFTDEDRMLWMTVASPTVAFLDGQELLLTVGCILPRFVRSEGVWSGDAVLVDSPRLEGLLTDLGVPLMEGG